MIAKLCLNCKRVIPHPLTYCADCQKQKNAKKSETCAGYNRRIRNSKHDRFYHSKAWKVLSASVLLGADYKCTECPGIACEVHHIESIGDNWDRRLDPGNLQPLCTRCHNRKR